MLFLAISIGATYYKMVVLQDFETTGIWLEFVEEESTYVFFVYENVEYELELETTDYNLILLSISDEVGIPVADLDPDFLEYLQGSYEEASSSE